jgi:hypothetical protein
MAYGGLRGAVGYSLVLSIDKNKAGPTSRISNQNIEMFFYRKKSFSYLYCIFPASALYRKSNLYIPKKGIARPKSQFLHSCVCERFIYSQDRSTYLAAEKSADRSWKYINLSEIYECKNWETEQYNSVLEMRRPHSFISGNT